MARLFASMLVVLVYGVVPVDNDPAKPDSGKAATNGDRVKSELEKLQGTWTCVGVEMDGQKLDGPWIPPITLVIKGEEYQETFEGAGEPLYKGSFKIDPGKKPKAFDSEGIYFGCGYEVVGIYEITGETLKICYDHGNKNRPKEFKSEHGSSFFTFEKKKK